MDFFRYRVHPWVKFILISYSPTGAALLSLDVYRADPVLQGSHTAWIFIWVFHIFV